MKKKIKKLNNDKYINIYIIIILFIILFIFVYIYRYDIKNGFKLEKNELINNKNYNYGYDKNYNINNNVLNKNIKSYEMKRPFLNIYDNNGKITKFVFITHPFSRDECIKKYNKGRENGLEFIGISSYCDFPKIISNPYDTLHDPNHKAWNYDYFKLCKGWCHCFRNPENYNIPPPDIYPQLLLSESDFAKYEKHIPDTTIKKEFDFIYICLKDNDKCEPGWQSFNRNWKQAEKLLNIMCNKYHLKGLLIGRIGCKIPSGCYELTDFLKYDEFIKQYNRCRFIFIPNYLDASPRVMVEALCYNLPVLCNYNILGGWKYITNETGEFFNVEENDFEISLKRFFKKFNTFKPREFYIREYNEEEKGKELLNFIKKCFGNKSIDNSIKYLVPGI